MNEWQTEAVRELSAIIYELSFDQYESKASLVGRLRQVTESLEILTNDRRRIVYIGKPRSNP